MGRTDVRVAAVASAAFVALTVLVMTGWGALIEFDRSVAVAADSFAAEHPAWVQLLKVVTHAAGPLTWRLAAVALGVALLLRREFAAAAFTLGAIAIGGVLSTAVKVGVDRARPEIPHPYANAAGMSFPSGHASTAVLTCGITLVLLLPRLRGWQRGLAWLLAVLVPLAIGYTRIGLDVHWVSDVVGGWLLGVAVVAAAHAVVAGRSRAPQLTLARSRSSGDDVTP